MDRRSPYGGHGELPLFRRLGVARAPLSSSMVHRTAILYLLAGMALTGANVPIGKAIVEEMPVYIFLFVRFLLAGLTLAFVVRGEKGPKLTEMAAAQARDLFLTGLIGMVGFTIFLFEGLKRTAASDAGIITGTLPAVVALLSVLVLRDSLTARRIASIGMAVVGLAVVHANGEGGGVRTLLGNSLVGAAVFCEAAFVILSKRLVPPFQPVRISFGANLVGLLLSLPLALLEWPRFNPETLHATIWSLTVWYALSSSVLCPLLWYRGLPHIDASIAGLTTSAMPVTALLVSAVALGEALDPLRIAGASLVVVAIVLGATEGGTQRRTFD